MKVYKRGRRYATPIKVGGKMMWLNTQKTTEREAKKAAADIHAVFRRERETRRLSGQLCEFIRMLVREEIAETDLATVAGRIQAEAYMEALAVIDRLLPRPPVSPQEVWDNYENSNDAVKPATVKLRRLHFNVFAKWAGGMDMATLQPVMCRRFLNSLKCAPQTWNNYISDISCVFKASANIGNPWADESLRADAADSHKEAEPNDPDAVRRLMAWLDAEILKDKDAETGGVPLREWAAFLRTLHYTGLRPIDACFLTAAEITPDGTVELKPEKTSRTRRKVSFRAAPALLKVIASIVPDESGRLFPHFAALRARNDSAINHRFKKILKAAALDGEKLALYGFRHAFVTWQLSNGADRTDLSAAIGHADTETTVNHYYHGRRNVELPPMPEI